jgi:hypothetical protein
MKGTAIKPVMGAITEELRIGVQGRSKGTIGQSGDEV